MKPADVVTEAMRRADGEFYYGTLEYLRGRVIFTYTEMRPGHFAPVDIRRVYSDIAAFSHEWRITNQMPLV
jgi:hypothetical protein